MKILATHPCLDRYGSDRMFLRSASGLSQRGCDVTVVTARAGELDEEAVSLGIAPLSCDTAILQKAYLNPIGLLGFFLRWQRAVRAHCTVIRRERPDVIYVNTVTLPAWITAGWLCRIPVVCHVHEAERGVPLIIQWALRAPLMLCNSIIANSDSTAAWLGRSKRLRSRSAVVYNGFVEPNAALPARSADGSAVLVGRLSPRKGQDIAIEAIAILHEKGREVVLRLVGDVFEGYEWFESELRDLAERRGVAHLICFEGYSAEVSSFIDAASVALVPSRTEPFGNVAVEALARACPVVVSGVDGLKEIVTDRVTGLVIAVGDPASLAAAILRILDDAPFAATLASQGRSAMLDRFGADRFAAEIYDVVSRAARRAI